MQRVIYNMSAVVYYQDTIDLCVNQVQLSNYGNKLRFACYVRQKISAFTSQHKGSLRSTQ